jgi:ADP-heptose:LPS heptosyltransferase
MPSHHHPVVILGGGIGDQLMAFPHLAAVAARAPEGKVLLITRQPRIMQTLLAGSGLVADVFDRPPRGLAGIKAMWRTARALAKHQPRESWCLYRSSKLAALPFLAGVPHRYGIRDTSFKERIFIPHGVAADEIDIPEAPPIGISSYLADALFARQGIGFDREGAYLPPLPAATAAAEQFIATLPPGPLIALGISASQVVRDWGAARFTELAAVLHRQYGARFLLFGAVDVRATAATIGADPRLTHAVAFDCTTSTAGLDFEHALLARCRLAICNDSFGLHLSALLGLPTIGLFGGSHPLPYRTNIICVESVHGWQAKRMDGIAVDQVSAAVAPFLA